MPQSPQAHAHPEQAHAPACARPASADSHLSAGSGQGAPNGGQGFAGAAHAGSAAGGGKCPGDGAPLASSSLEGSAAPNYGGSSWELGVREPHELTLGPRGSLASSSGGSWVGVSGTLPAIGPDSRARGSSELGRPANASADDYSTGAADGAPIGGGVMAAEEADAPANTADGGPCADADTGMAADGAAAAEAARRSASSGLGSLGKPPDASEGLHDGAGGGAAHRSALQSPQRSWDAPEGTAQGARAGDRAGSLGRPPRGRPPVSPKRGGPHTGADLASHAMRAAPLASGARDASGFGAVETSAISVTGGVAAPAGADVAEEGEAVPPLPRGSPLGAPSWLAPPPEPAARGWNPGQTLSARSSSRGRGLQRVAIAEGGTRGWGLGLNPNPASPPASAAGVGLADWGPSASLDSTAGGTLGVVGVDPDPTPGGRPRGLQSSPSMESLAPMLGDAHGSSLDAGAGAGGAKRWSPAPAPLQMTRSGRRRLVSPMQALSLAVPCNSQIIKAASCPPGICKSSRVSDMLNSVISWTHGLSRNAGRRQPEVRLRVNIHLYFNPLLTWLLRHAGRREPGGAGALAGPPAPALGAPGLPLGAPRVLQGPDRGAEPAAHLPPAGQARRDAGLPRAAAGLAALGAARAVGLRARQQVKTLQVSVRRPGG